MFLFQAPHPKSKHLSNLEKHNIKMQVSVWSRDTQAPYQERWFQLKKKTTDCFQIFHFFPYLLLFLINKNNLFPCADH